MIAGLLLTLQIIVCVALVAVILLQRSEGGALGIGGGGGGFLTARGTGDLLTRATSILGAMFFIISLSLVFVSQGNGGGSVTNRVRIQDIDPTAPAGARPAGTAPGQPGGGLAVPTQPARSGASAPVVSASVPAPRGIQAPTPGLQAPSGPVSIVPTAPAAPAASAPATPAPASR